MFPEQLRKKSEFVGSEGTRQAWTKHSKKWLRPIEFFGKFLSDPALNLFRNLGDKFLSHSRIKCVLRLSVSRIFRCFSRKSSWFILFPWSSHESEGKILSVVKTELGVNFITKGNISSYYEGETFLSKWTVIVFKKNNTVPKATNFYKIKNVFISPIYTFFWPNCLHAKSRYK